MPQIALITQFFQTRMDTVYVSRGVIDKTFALNMIFAQGHCLFRLATSLPNLRYYRLTKTRINSKLAESTNEAEQMKLDADTAGGGKISSASGPASPKRVEAGETSETSVFKLKTQVDLTCPLLTLLFVMSNYDQV